VTHEPAHEPAHEPQHDPAAARRFRRTLLRVMSVQVVTLLLLYLLQQYYSK
jgi:hypothetical protein